MIARRLGLPVILGYLIGGIAVGPYGFGLVGDVEQIRTLAEIGVVLLLFTLGLEFSLKTLRRTGRVAIIGGMVQILATTALGLVVGLLLHWPLTEAVFFGFFIALSSTMIVLKLLMERGELDTAHGRVMIGILLVQDLAVVPMMVVLPVIGEPGWAAALGIAALKAVRFLGAMLVLGLWVLPRVMRRVAGLRSRELFLLAIFGLCLAVAFASDYFGISLALGAFVAGLLMSESDYAHQALADVRLGVAHLYDCLGGVDAGIGHVLQHHPRVRATGRNLGGTHAAIGHIAPPGRFFLDQLHRLEKVPRRGADGDPALAERGDRLQRAGDQVGIVGQARQLQRLKFDEHVVDVLLGDRPAVYLCPGLGYLLHLADGLDVIAFVQPHRAAGLFHGDLDAVSPVYLDQHHGRGGAAIVQRRAGPVEDHELYRATVRSLIDEFHGRELLSDLGCDGYWIVWEPRDT